MLGSLPRSSPIYPPRPTGGLWKGSIPMMNNPLPIQDFLQPGKRVHLVGIGGVSMCPLAWACRSRAPT